MAVTITATQSAASYVLGISAASNTLTGNITISILQDGDTIYTFAPVAENTTVFYTFEEPFEEGAYSAYAVIGEDPDYDFAELDLEVLNYLPEFTLTPITCKEYKVATSIVPADMNLNENSLCPVDSLDEEITYQRYSKIDGDWVLQDEETITITDLVDPVDPSGLAYQWTPTRLEFVKIIVTIQNCSGSTTKEIEFPICGTYKIRRMSCGNYRAYNYKTTSLTYSIYDKEDALVVTGSIPSMSYIEFTIDTDTRYKFVADSITQFIFNYCELEACLVSLEKSILTDSLCESCGCDNEAKELLKQKVLRMIPLYELWKKLLDPDGIYEIKYTTSDLGGELARIYSADELYTELAKLCDECSNQGCGC